MKKFLSLLIAAIVVFSFVACSSEQSQSVTGEADSTIINSASNSTDDTKYLSPEEFMKSTEILLSNSYGENYSVERTDSGFTISVWLDGLDETIENTVYTKDASLIDSWNSLLDAFASSCSTTVSSAKTLTNLDLTITQHLLSDSDHETILATVENGVILFNSLSDLEPKVATTGERNALSKAKSYLGIMNFSYSGLVSQLEYESFSNSEATYAVDNCGADWNEQAAGKAKAYLDTMSFSRQGLIDQLLYEGFTQEQAVYGVTQNGY